MNEDKISLSMVLEDDLAKQFNAIKKYYCLENNTDQVRILISEKYRELFPKKVQVHG